MQVFVILFLPSQNKYRNSSLRFGCFGWCGTVALQVTAHWFLLFSQNISIPSEGASLVPVVPGILIRGKNNSPSYPGWVVFVLQGRYQYLNHRDLVTQITSHDESKAGRKCLLDSPDMLLIKLRWVKLTSQIAIKFTSSQREPNKFLFHERLGWWK